MNNSVADIQNVSVVNSNRFTIRGYLHKSASTEKPLILYVHGFRGRMSQKFISFGAEKYADLGYDVLRFDLTNHIGESDGDFYNFSTNEAIDDIQTVISYIIERDLAPHGIILIGHSLGGLLNLLAINEKNICFIKKVVFLSSVLFTLPGGYLSHRMYKSHEEGKDITFEYKDKNNNAVEFKLGWQAQAESMKLGQSVIDSKLQQLTIPKLFYYFGNDEAIPELLFHTAFERAAEPKTFYTLPHAPHNPILEEHIDLMCKTVSLWVEGS